MSAVSLVLFMFRLHRLFMAEKEKQNLVLVLLGSGPLAGTASVLLALLLQLRDSRPASVTGVSHRFRTCRQARCSDSNLKPASPN